MTTFNVGETGIVGDTLASGNNSLSFSQPITLSVPASLVSLSIYLNPSGTSTNQCAIGIYDDDGTGLPNNLLSQTALQLAVTGWQTLVATTGVLSPNIYHLALIDPGDSTLQCPFFLSSTYSIANVTTLGVFPNPWVSASTGTGHLAIYATFDDGIYVNTAILSWLHM